MCQVDTCSILTKLMSVCSLSETIMWPQIFSQKKSSLHTLVIKEHVVWCLIFVDWQFLQDSESPKTLVSHRSKGFLHTTGNSKLRNQSNGLKIQS